MAIVEGTMTIRLFISSVTDSDAALNRLPDPLRTRISESLKLAKLACVHQECIPERGVNTLVKIAAVIKDECDYVIHFMGINRGATPSLDAVRELWRHLPKSNFESRFPFLFQTTDDSTITPLEQLTYTEWEAWIAKYYDKHMFCCCHVAVRNRPGSKSQAGCGGQSDELTAHFHMLKPYAGYPEWYTSDEELLSKIKDHLLGELVSRISSVSTRPPALSWPNVSVPVQASIADRGAQLGLLLDLLSPNRLERALLLYGPSSRGKSFLISEFERQLERIHSVSFARSDFKGGVSLSDVLGAIWDALSYQLKLGSRPPKPEIERMLFACLADTTRPVVLLLDTFEEAIPECISWVEERLLPFVGRFDGVRLVVTGHCVPKSPVNWRNQNVECHELLPIDEPHYWIKYRDEVALRSATDDEVEKQVEVAMGDPSLIDAWLLAQPEVGK